jgi:hypothetical protein
MDDRRFDALTRALRMRPTRRTAIASGLSALASIGLASGHQATAAKRRKKRKCPKGRRCGKKRCCGKGQICAAGKCITGQGSCPAGTDSCVAGIPVLCSDNCLCLTSMEGATRCGQAGVSGPCGGCASSSDCAAFGAGAFCAAAGTGCGCQAGEGMCVAPCLG